MALRLLIEMASGLIILDLPAIACVAAQQIIARQASAPESAQTAQRSTPAERLIVEIGQPSASATVASPVTTVQETQPAAAPPKGAAQNGSVGKPTGADDRQRHSALRQARRSRSCTHRPDRYDWRTRIRSPASQRVRFPS